MWPKTPGKRIYYNETPGVDEDEDRRNWDIDRSLFLDSFSAAGEVFPSHVIDEIRSMTYDVFVRLFSIARGAAAKVRQEAIERFPYESGHVAIIDIDKSTQRAFVIEAIKGTGVSISSYDSWSEHRSKQQIWHGRIKNLSLGDGARFAAAARSHIGKPYWLWSCWLDNDRHFYCSKLVWLSAMKAIERPLDGISSSYRFPWVSPAQILYGGSIDILHSPGGHYLLPTDLRLPSP